MALQIKSGYWHHVYLCLATTLICMLSMPANADNKTCTPWPLWEAYWSHFVQGDGRVIDHGETADPSYSEGQAYTLFFTLVNNDRSRFELILNWIQREMAHNDLRRHLPAWKWGQRQGSDWGVIDDNPASDADMWLAYTLLEAGHLWNAPEYTSLGQAVLQNIKQRELTYPPDIGVMISPGAEGFSEADMWRFNPSYIPLQQLSYFAMQDKAGPWSSIKLHTISMLQAISPHGFAPDWALYHRSNGWRADQVKGALGSYDAIRIYLWAGMLNDQDKTKPMLLKTLKGMQQYLQTQDKPPLNVNTESGTSHGTGPIGFSAALLPYLKSLKQDKQLEVQQKHLQLASHDNLLGNPPRYYDQVLALFGQGWLEQRYAFKSDGSLENNWDKRCP